jgi:hypothetical protein
VNNYPILSPDKEDDRKELLRHITKERYQDIKDFDNLQNRFMAGRKVGKVATGASDVDPSDRVGDFNYDDQYFYILIDNAGTAEWRRATLASW